MRRADVPSSTCLTGHCGILLDMTRPRCWRTFVRRPVGISDDSGPPYGASHFPATSVACLHENNQLDSKSTSNQWPSPISGIPEAQKTTHLTIAQSTQ